jgi:hypothetical protein
MFWGVTEAQDDKLFPGLDRHAHHLDVKAFPYTDLYKKKGSLTSF